MSQIRELWQYDLVRQSVMAFALGLLAVGAMMAVIIASTPAFRGGLSTVNEETARLSGESRGRFFADRLAARDADRPGREAAAADLPGLVEAGARSEGFELAYEYAWNEAVNQMARSLPRQLLAQEEGIQWIELLR